MPLWLHEGSRQGVEVLRTWTFTADRFRINNLTDVDGPLLHNHPWEWCWSLILHGGYTHEFFELDADGQPGPTQMRTFRPGDVNFMPNGLFHRIHAVEPNTYTQIMWGPDMPDQNTIHYWVNGRAEFRL